MAAHIALSQQRIATLRASVVLCALCATGWYLATWFNAQHGTLVSDGLQSLLLFGVGMAAIRMGSVILFHILLPALRAPAPRIFEEIMVLVSYSLWGLFTLHQIGVDLSHLVTTSAILTAVVAFAMQDTLGNVLGGMALHIDESIKIGDWLRMGELYGQVKNISWRHVNLIAPNGETIIVPNSFLMRNHFVVIHDPVAQEATSRRLINFHVGLEHHPQRICDLVSQSVEDARIDHVALSPKPPDVVVSELGAGFIGYTLRYWLLQPPMNIVTDSRVRMEIFQALERSGIALAHPGEVAFLMDHDQRHAKQLAQRESTRRLHALQSIDLFQSLRRDELIVLAEHLMHAPFAANDVMIQQGSTAHWLYILVSGQADVWLEKPGYPKQHITVLKEGAVFGEMGLMVGEPRRATVVAKTDCDCYRLNKAGLEAILRTRPAIAEEISYTLAQRETELHEVQRTLPDTPMNTSNRHHRLLSRIRAFFFHDQDIA